MFITKIGKPGKPYNNGELDFEKKINQNLHKRLKIEVENCIFCKKYSQYNTFGPILNKALYAKYSSS